MTDEKKKEEKVLTKEEKVKDLKATYFDCDVQLAQINARKQQIVNELNKLLESK